MPRFSHSTVLTAPAIKENIALILSAASFPYSSASKVLISSFIERPTETPTLPQSIFSSRVKRNLTAVFRPLPIVLPISCQNSSSLKAPLIKSAMFLAISTEVACISSQVIFSSCPANALLMRAPTLYQFPLFTASLTASANSILLSVFSASSFVFETASDIIPEASRISV